MPVHYHHTDQLIEETEIDNSKPWARSMLNRIQNSYQKAPFFESYFSELSDLLLEPAASISDLNLRLINWVCSHLEIKTPLSFSREYHPKGVKTERLIGLLKQVGATAYLSGPAAKVYIEPELFGESSQSVYGREVP